MMRFQTMSQPQHHLPAATERNEEPGVRHGRRLVLGFGSLACVLLVVTSMYAFVVPRTPGRMTLASAALIDTVPLWSWLAHASIQLASRQEVVAAALLLLGGAAFAAYALAVCLSWRRAAPAPVFTLVFGAALCAFAISALALPTADTDIFNYIANGRVATVYHSNPYYVPVDRFPNDPIYPYAGKQYTATPDNKLPTWMLISLPLNVIAGNDPTTNLLIFRLAFLLFNVANLALIAIILRRIQPAFRLTGTIIYGWNPIVIVQGQGKTDTVIVFFLLVAILLLIRGRRHLATIALSLSVFIKWLTLPLVIVYWVRLVRLRQWTQLLIDVALFGLVTLVVYAPFARSPRLLLDHLRLVSAGGRAAPRVVQTVLAIGYIVVILWIGLKQDGSLHKLLYGFVVASVYFSLLLIPIQFSRYLMPMIALVSLVDSWPIAAVSTALSFVSFLINQWYSAATGGYKLPQLTALSRSLVYLSLLTLIAVGALVLITQRALRQRYTN